MIVFKGVDDLGNLDDMLDDDGGQENYRKNNLHCFGGFNVVNSLILYNCLKKTGTHRKLP